MAQPSACAFKLSDVGEQGLFIQRIEYYWGKSLRVFASLDKVTEHDIDDEVDLGIDKSILRSLITKSGAAFAEALVVLLFGLNGNPEFVKVDYSAAQKTVWYRKN